MNEKSTLKKGANKFLTHTMKNKGITLVALIVTIIILLILAGITISQLMGSGLFENAKLVQEKAKEAQEKEEGILSDYENKVGEYLDGARNTSATFKTIYNNPSGAESGTLDESINNFDMLVAIYGSAIGENVCNSTIFTPNYAQIEINFGGSGAALYGTLKFSNSAFSRTILFDNGGWAYRYLIYQVIGIKF